MIMDSPPKLADLDGPPVVGSTYLVLCAHAKWGAKLDWYPMLGQPHLEPDRKGFGQFLDWHLDARFLTDEQEIHAAFCEVTHPVIHAATFPEPEPGQRWIGSRASRQFIIPWLKGLGHARPPSEYRPLVCRRPTIAPEPLAEPWPELAERYGDPADAIRGKDGKVYCPHHKLELTHEPRDCDGIVICPLHRLRVKCGEASPAL